MTLGKKLSNHRKMLGFTQQQLGEHLNLSAQAVSKWENDLAEPDIATLVSLANLYSVTVDDLLNLNDNENFSAKNGNFTEEDTSSLKTIGFCKDCGIMVTEENKGELSPVSLCSACLERKNERIALEREALIKHEEDLKLAAEAKKQNIIETSSRRTKKSVIVAGIFTVAFFVLWIVITASNFSFGTFLAGLIISYAVFSFVACLFYDTAVIEVLEYMGTASINWPGIIFTLDMDGLIFLIAVKALFAVLGFIFGLVCAVIGFFFSMFISMFIYPFVLGDVTKSMKKGVPSKYEELIV